MTKLHVITMQEGPPVVWEAYPSRAQFAWLYMVSALAALRGAILFRFEVVGWEVWLWGAGFLILCAVLLRRWGHYELTREQITVRNGYTGHEIQSVPVRDIEDVTIQQGPVAEFLGIGTVLVHARASNRLLLLRGVNDPEWLKVRIDALAWKLKRKR